MDISTCYDLSGKTVLVTGASGGLGAQIVNCFSSAGARVIMASRNIAKLNTIAAQLKDVNILQMDVADRVSVTQAFKSLALKKEKIDICINNAAIMKLTQIFEGDLNDDFAEIMRTNVVGVWNVTKMAAMHMREHHIAGSIINISSAGGGSVCRPNVTGYYASKAAVIKLSQNLVSELSPHHIRINTVLPGTLYTGMTSSRLQNDAEHQKIKDSIPMRRLGNVEDLDGVMLYLASNQASAYVTGSVIAVDGGLAC